MGGDGSGTTNALLQRVASHCDHRITRCMTLDRACVIASFSSCASCVGLGLHLLLTATTSDTE